MGMHHQPPSSSSTASHSAAAVHPLPTMSLSMQCSACPYCQDTCGDDDCGDCHKKQARQRCRDRVCVGVCCNKDDTHYTLCQIQRHDHAESAWLVADGYVYDVTDYLASQSHPGGDKSILRKCGGAVDCRRDLQFHSPNGKRLWKRYRIGTVQPCPKETGKIMAHLPLAAQDTPQQDRNNNKLWWMFWK